ncbi:MAG TPA: class I SAM-dependent methyltransferase [Ktedonobacteraceae bacterium]|nr:class I SAM-dependent methyltransferase [Ktedonobacteraceae bacterium]
MIECTIWGRCTVAPRLRRLLFETLYKNAYLYRFASTVPFAGQWRVWQRLLLSRIHGNDVLELGCGLGDLLADMSAAGYLCHAVENSPQMVKAARETLRRRKLDTNAIVIQGSAQHLPFSNDSFDTVVSTFPSEYIYDPDTVAEVARVLRAGGRFIVIEGANLLPIGFLQPFLVLIQTLVYGRASVYGPRKHRNLDEEAARNRSDQKPKRNATRNANEVRTVTKTEVISDAWFGQYIPLEYHGLKRRSERVRSRRWEVYITIGEKQ